MIRRPVRALAWLVGIAGAGVALRLASTGALAAPPLGSVDGLLAWVDGREPATAGLALVRLVAELSAWYVLAVSALHAIAVALRFAGGHRLADALSVPGVRRLVHAGLGVGLAAASTVGGGRGEVTAPGTATMVPVEAPVRPSHPAEAVAGTATMRPRQAPAPQGTAVMAPAPTTWTVAPGESLWSIAEDLLAETWQRPPTTAEVDPLWRALVEVNRGRLADPSDPDLIHPGQVFEVPPLPSPET